MALGEESIREFIDLRILIVEFTFQSTTNEDWSKMHKTTNFARFLCRYGKCSLNWGKESLNKGLS